MCRVVLGVSSSFKSTRASVAFPACLGGRLLDNAVTLLGAGIPSDALVPYFLTTAWLGFVALGGKPADDHQNRECLSSSERWLWPTERAEWGLGSLGLFGASRLFREGPLKAEPLLATWSGVGEKLGGLDSHSSSPGRLIFWPPSLFTMLYGVWRSYARLLRAYRSAGARVKWMCGSVLIRSWV